MPTFDVDDLQFIEETLLQGNASAASFVNVLLDVLQTWDDLIDGDREVSADRVHRAFRSALVLLPASPFFQEHRFHIWPLLDAALIDWVAANALETTGDFADRQIAFITRSSYIQILLRCAQIVGGFEHAAAVAPELRRRVHAEGFNNYLAALRAENRRT